MEIFHHRAHNPLKGAVKDGFAPGSPSGKLASGNDATMQKEEGAHYGAAIHLM